VMDVALVAAARRSSTTKSPIRMLIAWAKQLGRNDCASVLQQALNEEKSTDQKKSSLPNFSSTARRRNLQSAGVAREDLRATKYYSAHLLTLVLLPHAEISLSAGLPGRLQEKLPTETRPRLFGSAGLRGREVGDGQCSDSKHQRQRGDSTCPLLLNRIAFKEERLTD
jgi:hypothetical protein